MDLPFENLNQTACVCKPLQQINGIKLHFNSFEKGLYYNKIHSWTFLALISQLEALAQIIVSLWWFSSVEDFEVNHIPLLRLKITAPLHHPHTITTLTLSVNLIKLDFVMQIVVAVSTNTMDFIFTHYILGSWYVGVGSAWKCAAHWNVCILKEYLNK